MHVASKYPDEVILNALFQLSTLDCGPIALNASRALACQPKLPIDWGDDLAFAAGRWIKEKPSIQLGGIQNYMVTIALKTQSDAARNEINKLL